jgi:hypothetical protein
VTHASCLISNRVFNPGHGCKHWDQRITRHLMIGSANDGPRNPVEIGEHSRSQLRSASWARRIMLLPLLWPRCQTSQPGALPIRSTLARQLWDTTISGYVVQASRPAPLVAPSLILTMGLLSRRDVKQLVPLASPLSVNPGMERVVERIALKSQCRPFADPSYSVDGKPSRRSWEVASLWHVQESHRQRPRVHYS